MAMAEDITRPMSRAEIRKAQREELKAEMAAFPRRKVRTVFSIEEKQRLMDEVFSRLCEGESLYLICEDAHMPSRGQVWRWMQLDNELMRRYDECAELRARSLFEAALFEIQRASCPQSAMIADRRSRIYLHAAALLDPRRYSQHTHSSLARNGIGNGAPLHITLNIGGQPQEQTRELTVIPQPEGGDLP